MIHHVYTHVQLVEKSEGIAYGLDKTLKYPKKYFLVYNMYFCLSTVSYNICISAFKNKRFVCLFVCITTGGSWEPSSGSYDAERHSLLDS